MVCETPTIKERKDLDKDKAVGLDLGLKYFVADSKGEKIKAPQYFRKSEYKLVKQQRQLSKKKKGGANRGKARKLVAKTHLTISRQRKDFLHKLAYKYAQSNDIVCMENLNVSGMVRNRHLAKSISDASWSIFQALLSDKLEKLGKKLVLVNPAYTSQICSQCGAIVRKSLSQRTHYCSECLYTEDRDVNAGKNILRLGMETSLGESASLKDSMNHEAHGFIRG